MASAEFALSWCKSHASSLLRQSFSTKELVCCILDFFDALGKRFFDFLCGFLKEGGRGIFTQ